MTIMTDSKPAVSSLAMAGLFLCARTLLQQLKLPHPTTKQILEATKATRTRAFEVSRDVEAALKEIVRPPGRPPSPSPSPLPPPHEPLAVARAVNLFLMANPGCALDAGQRGRYTDIFRHRILELRRQYPELDLADFAHAVCVPKGTLEDWLRAGAKPPVTASEDSQPADDDEEDLKQTKIEAVLHAWKHWRGSFSHFCKHIRSHHHIDFGNSLISSILAAHGERKPRPRPGRSPDEEALRGSFETFFPGAQWVGDGTPLNVTLDGEPFGFNFELFVDAASDAHVGLSVRDTEDSPAVIDAFQAGVATTQTQPLAVLLDNRPPNHTDQVQDALDPTLRIRATENRAQNKAHVEGAFGTFSQTAPDLEVSTGNRRELARQIAFLVLLTYCRAINGRPRKDKGGKSRLDLYQAPVTDEERAKAKEALLARQRKQEAARRTLEARLDPILRDLLDRAFERLELLDPERYIRNAIARYPLDDILDSIAIFDGKATRSTLPQGVDARYLFGIVRNVHHVHESEAITEALLRARIEAHDKALRSLVEERDNLLTLDVHDALDTLVDRACQTDSTFARFFWLIAVADLVRQQPEHDRESLARSAARRIHATFRVPPWERRAAERFLMRHIWPIE